MKNKIAYLLILFIYVGISSSCRTEENELEINLSVSNYKGNNNATKLLLDKLETNSLIKNSVLQVVGNSNTSLLLDQVGLCCDGQKAYFIVPLSNMKTGEITSYLTLSIKDSQKGNSYCLSNDLHNCLFIDMAFIEKCELKECAQYISPFLKWQQMKFPLDKKLSQKIENKINILENNLSLAGRSSESTSEYTYEIKISVILKIILDNPSSSQTIEIDMAQMGKYGLEPITPMLNNWGVTPEITYDDFSSTYTLTLKSSTMLYLYQCQVAFVQWKAFYEASLRVTEKDNKCTYDFYYLESYLGQFNIAGVQPSTEPDIDLTILPRPTANLFKELWDVCIKDSIFRDVATERRLSFSISPTTEYAVSMYISKDKNYSININNDLYNPLSDGEKKIMLLHQFGHIIITEKYGIPSTNIEDYQHEKMISDPMYDNFIYGDLKYWGTENSPAFHDLNDSIQVRYWLSADFISGVRPYGSYNPNRGVYYFGIINNITSEYGVTITTHHVSKDIDLAYNSDPIVYIIRSNNPKYTIAMGHINYDPEICTVRELYDNDIVHPLETKSFNRYENSLDYFKPIERNSYITIAVGISSNIYCTSFVDQQESPDFQGYYRAYPVKLLNREHSEKTTFEQE